MIICQLQYGIKYNNPEYSNVGSGKYNGSIAEIDWQNASENVQKRYTYTYDGLNRLKDAVYSEPASTTPFNNYYNEYLTYDVNGNIKTLKRNAFPVSGTTATQVDDLVYDYTGNRLTKVTENALNDTGYEGGNNTITYDLNGNMKDMPDKGIQSITYNFLNLSNGYSMQQTNGLGQLLNSMMSYLYRADGTKLRKTYSSAPPRGSTTTRITDYLDGFQYSYTEGGGICLECRTETAYEQQAYKNASFVFPGTPTPEWKLDFAATAEGYYSFTENRYIYQYKDHLGNTRVSFAKDSTGAPEIIDTNNYYPFGLNHISGSFSTSGFGSFYSYKYNGKELQENGMYDYGARMYMPDLGRWGTTDPLAEAFRRFSPYHYGADNPVMFIDPDGMRNVPYDGGVISNVPEGSWWFAGMNGSFTPEYIVNSGLGKRTGGGSTATNIILNFIRGDAGHLGNFVNNDFEKNGWHVIDASSLKDALEKLTAYLGKNLADNIYINAHGLESQRYVFDEKGELIPDSNSGTGYRMTGDTGFYTNLETEKILGSHIQQYISDKSKLSKELTNSIDSLIGISNYVKDGKNLIVGSCHSVRYDDLFGTGISTIVKSRDIFVNRDYSGLWPNSQGTIRFQDFTGFNQTSRENYIDGWVWYRDGVATQRNFNIIMTKYGVKTIK
ncbi:RHS repeat domain-containing protein [Chryseobacterium sp. S90]|uniref:RHS repeat domain-containing protein n=1 Tax=Chryseobacterium sp. S90 TaxID=3395373 RepID=UPI0039BC98D7